MMSNNNRAPNFFWPVILIGAGAILLLSNLGLYSIAVPDLVVLVQLWPLLLVAMGVNLLFGRNRSWPASILSLVMGLAVVAAFLLAPNYVQPAPNAEFVNENFSEPLSGVDSARVNLDFDRGTFAVYPLYDHRNLALIEVRHNQELTYHASGSNHRSVRLTLDSRSQFGFFNFLEEQQTIGEIGLDTGTPIDLTVDIGGGHADLNLDQVYITALDVNSGSGTIDLIHPKGSLRTSLGAGSGTINIQTVAGTDLDLKAEVGSGTIRLDVESGVVGQVDLQSGSGSITVYLPEGTAVRIIGSTGSGQVNLPQGFQRVSGSGGISGDSGTWQSPGFEDATKVLVIEFNVGSGNFRLVYQ